MRRRCLLLAALAFAGATPIGVTPAGADEPLLVFAAASLGDALREVGAAYEARTGRSVLFSFAGSGDLARQIRAGAPAGVFVSADAARVDELERAGLVAPRGRSELFSNRLVVVVPASSTLVLRGAGDLAGVERLAIADPLSVPAGAYARQWLERAGAWERLRDRVVPALDVRAALAAVESGNAPAGIVYATDAAASRRVRVALEAPPAESPRIVYVAALLAGAPPSARAFYAELRSSAAAAVFRRFGFVVLQGP